MNNTIDKIMDKNVVISGMNNKPCIANILHNLETTLDIDGDIVELGCHFGTVSLFIRRLLDESNSGKEFHVYDSFKGLPKPSNCEPVKGAEGAMQIGRDVLESKFRDAGLDLPIVHEGWFKDIPDDEYPEKICFAFFDSDYYESILDSFKKVYPRLSKGAVVVVHDYTHPLWKLGVRMACAEFLQDKPEKGKMFSPKGIDAGVLVKE